MVGRPSRLGCRCRVRFFATRTSPATDRTAPKFTVLARRDRARDPEPFADIANLPTPLQTSAAGGLRRFPVGMEIVGGLATTLLTGAAGRGLEHSAGSLSIGDTRQTEDRKRHSRQSLY